MRRFPTAPCRERHLVDFGELCERRACLQSCPCGPAVGTSISPVLCPCASRITSCPCALACRWSRLARVRLDTLPCEYPIAHETTQPLTVQTMLGSQEVKKVCMMGQAFLPRSPLTHREQRSQAQVTASGSM